jgi:hypothetical protein
VEGVVDESGERVCDAQATQGRASERGRRVECIAAGWLLGSGGASQRVRAAPGWMSMRSARLGPGGGALTAAASSDPHGLQADGLGFDPLISTRVRRREQRRP